MYQKSAAIGEVITLANDTARLLGFDQIITPNEVTLYDDYIGEGYGIPTEGCIEAIRLVAQTEAIFLDPVYSAKAMAGFVDLIRKGEFISRDTVLFIHTGGVPALFAYHQ
ncbi:pyridoxal-phosphate dependent enzyme, partial [Dehalococcoidia bacterium]|nr:pyridoxal-phosphate dependent enzyme [Dehalococcoidia bacterium]